MPHEAKASSDKRTLLLEGLEGLEGFALRGHAANFFPLDSFFPCLLS
jgi:hypothetical protein